jgi:flagellar biogenesis protein FliO
VSSAARSCFVILALLIALLVVLCIGFVLRRFLVG